MSEIQLANISFLFSFKRHFEKELKKNKFVEIASIKVYNRKKLKISSYTMLSTFHNLSSKIWQKMIFLKILSTYLHHRSYQNWTRIMQKFLFFGLNPSISSFFVFIIPPLSEVYMPLKRVTNPQNATESYESNFHGCYISHFHRFVF